MAKKQIKFEVIHIQVPISEEEREARIKQVGRLLVSMDRKARAAQEEQTSQSKVL